MEARTLLCKAFLVCMHDWAKPIPLKSRVCVRLVSASRARSLRLTPVKIGLLMVMYIYRRRRYRDAFPLPIFCTKYK